MGMRDRPSKLEPASADRRVRRSTDAAASPAEAAAIVAALARFARDTAPRLAPATTGSDPWARAAILEAVGHEPDAPSPWVDPLPWS
jgi:hypothetical protein